MASPWSETWAGAGLRLRPAKGSSSHLLVVRLNRKPPAPPPHPKYPETDWTFLCLSGTHVVCAQARKVVCTLLRPYLTYCSLLVLTKTLLNDSKLCVFWPNVKNPFPGLR